LWIIVKVTALQIIPKATGLCEMLRWWNLLGYEQGDGALWRIEKMVAL
jgi:hypothetical protein